MKKLICIIGPDGGGKTTQAKILISNLNRKGINCRYKWMRFFHFTSLPILAWAKLKGFSEEIELTNGRKIGYHYFEKSRLLSEIYSLTLFLDTLLFNIIQVKIPLRICNHVIVCDRYIQDTLTDLMVSIGDSDFINSGKAKKFFKLIPKNSYSLLLTSNASILKNRRNDVLFDKNMDIKIEIYDEIAEHLNIIRIDASLTIDMISTQIMEKIGNVS